MDRSEVSPEVERGLALIAEGLSVLASTDLAPGDVAGAGELIRQVEAVGRRVDALQVRVLGAIEGSGTFAVDGHGSAKAMVAHIGHLSSAEASRRARRVRALGALPAVAAAQEAGHLGTCQVDRIARVHANPRVRPRFVDLDDDLAVVARRLPYREFDLLLADWEALADEDGARDRNQRAHERRDHRISQEFDRTATIAGRCGAMDGARLRAIQQRFEEAEFGRDWAEARATHGDGTTRDHLGRTDAQRRFDATKAIFEAAAAHHATQPGGSPITFDVVMDHLTFERELRKLAGEGVPPRMVDLQLRDVPGPDLDRRAPGNPRVLGGDRSSGDPRHPDGSGDPGTSPEASGAPASAPGPSSEVGFRCDTLDGWRLEPTEAVVVSLLSKVRRAVVGAAGRIVDLGRTQRLFTGAASAAAHLRARTCIWPGCNVAARWCQVDHVVSWHDGGRTDQDNSALLCGRHNRLKEARYRVRCDADGTWHTHRPDGAEIDAGRGAA